MKTGLRMLAALMVAFLMIWVPIVHSFARAPEVDGVQFLESRAIDLVLLPEASNVKLELTVLNASPAPAAITLDLPHFTNSDGVAYPPQAISGLPQTSPQVDPGATYTFHLVFNRAEVDAGTFTGELVAYSEQGSADQLGISLELRPPEAAQPPVSPEGVDPLYLPALTRSASKQFPSWLETTLQRPAVAPVVVQISPVYSATQRIVGQVTADDGALAAIHQDGTRLWIDNLSHAGKYIGKADLQPSEPSKGELSLAVNVRHMGIYPLLVIFCGLLIAAGLEKFVKETRPMRQLKIKLDEIKQTALDWQNAFPNRAKNVVWPKDWPVYRIYLPPENGKLPPSLLGDRAGEILKRYEQAVGAAEQAKWGPEGSEVATLEGYVEKLKGMHEGALKVCKQYVRLKSEVKDFDKLPVAIQAGRAICDPCETGDPAHPYQVFVTVKELTDADTNLTAARDFLDTFVDLHDELKTWLEQAQGDDKETIRKWQEELTNPYCNLDLEQLKKFKTAVESQVGTILKPRREIGKEGKDEIAEPAGLGQILSHLPVGLFPMTVDIPSESPSQTLDRLRTQEFRYWLITSLIVLYTGYQAIYLSNLTFGAWTDYLGALLWGAAVGTGFQIARTLLPAFKL